MDGLGSRTNLSFIAAALLLLAHLAFEGLARLEIPLEAVAELEGTVGDRGQGSGRR